MDIRFLELDVHWFRNEVVLCHGETVDADVATADAGCSVDRTLADGLAEIRAWLDDNPDEVIGIYLENALDGELAPHDAAVAALDAELGELVYRPAGGACDALPATTVTRREIRESGARVFLVGNCGPGAWGGWVYERDQANTWRESGSGFGDDFPAYPACATEAQPWGSKPWVRVYEDSTWLSQMGGGGGELTTEETRRAVGCGVTMPGFDQLEPHDPRLEALVWSWRPGRVAAGCAYRGVEDGRLSTDDCKPPRQVACLASDRTWYVTRSRATWDQAQQRCAARGGRFVAPWNGLANNALGAVATSDVWVAHRVS